MREIYPLSVNVPVELAGVMPAFKFFSVLFLGLLRIRHQGSEDKYDVAEPAAKGGGGEYCESEQETDGPEKILELRQLFDLYDVDASGFVDAKEILAALRGNYTAHQVGRTTVSVTFLCYVMLT